MLAWSDNNIGEFQRMLASHVNSCLLVFRTPEYSFRSATEENGINHLEFRHFDWFHSEFRATEQSRPGIPNKQFHFGLECAHCCSCGKLSDGLFYSRQRLLAQNALCMGELQGFLQLQLRVVPIMWMPILLHTYFYECQKWPLQRAMHFFFNSSSAIGYLNGCCGLTLKHPHSLMLPLRLFEGCDVFRGSNGIGRSNSFYPMWLDLLFLLPSQPPCEPVTTP